MLTSHERIERQKSRPALARLHHALSRLTSTATVMNTGAHPDDEQNGLLAMFRFGLGMRVVIACSTRGEGGQNALGPERLGALGVLRSRELEEAARQIDADVHWLGHGPEDPVHDFGFSKDGDATFARWDEKRIIERLVRAYRQERPDIVIPTFLDVPGQHGHHRAMTRAAEAALALAADAGAYPEHCAEGLTPWRVAKYYLPAWPGGGDTYDDEIPPPDATIAIDASGTEPATGAAYDHIGEWSRAYHASQGMGVWRDTPRLSWPLHLRHGPRGSQSEHSILEDIPATLADLAGAAGHSAGSVLLAAHDAISNAIQAFPERDRITMLLLDAAGYIDSIEALASPDFMAWHGHRLDRKRREIDAALLETAGIDVRAVTEPQHLSPGSTGRITVHMDNPSIPLPDGISITLPSDVTVVRSQDAARSRSFDIKAAATAALTNPYGHTWSSLGGNGAAFANVTARIGNRQVQGTFDLEEPLSIVPKHSLTLLPEAIIARRGDAMRSWPIRADGMDPAVALRFDAPPGWTVRPQDGQWLLSAPEMLPAGLTQITPEISGHPAMRSTPISYPHTGRCVFIAPERLRVLALDLKLPEGAKIAYAGGGADRVALWLQRMGLDVTELDAEALGGDLSRFTTIVVGIFTFGLRKDLSAATERLHGFVENGGHLVTLYHRPGDGWIPSVTPPRYLKIGSPSLRWRVTDPHARVTILLPRHPLLTGPNIIGPADWDGWDKERGLYFASDFDDAYEPLLSMHDANEQPLNGGLISARIGKGRHTHTGLVLHHQLDRLVPGAFRLMANLVQPA
ncbi:PIG-L family deacetylase [Phyllobacterium myrsinacearum]|uniref:PIG-L domain-containing protein n=1 Tax=Phyllobacterium myrsinacearum TaxID=28101 RepID=A0A2S9JFS3_9HYPH|nr:PIG-L family deacetylase [Phyllobacterium myrsinacearum]PRD51774.1 PIG-L domain-containing protein [Phyllobacterium myrsinacearum]PWV83614.1 LmbE family N-acetylglucosaminyl deacetylase [Phyllobacterium myrsinacearum]RZV00064.1 LmbE family N-acetylglucosaminyl deacetylase [Phyllobacterium myrsinacearum]